MATYLWLDSMDGIEAERFYLGLGAIPKVLSGEAELLPELVMLPAPATLISYQFLHGSILHLVFNMAFLWVFGDNIEDAMGHWRFLVFYLMCGVIAGLIHAAADPGAVIPIVGASGAISGVLGAYLVLHPRAKILVPVIIVPLYLPAYILLLFWIGFQVFSAVLLTPDQSNVAWWAHIGGFLAGMILVVPFRHKTLPLWDGSPLPTGVSIRPRSERTQRDDSADDPWS